ncbi:MAG: hypothetical protein LUI02_00005, partial [Clostridiales bacterium]|nr:hypothetical protein [Clostridiales bacterium]
EILKKEDINSGTQMEAAESQLHTCLLQAMFSSACMPMDVLENAEVTKEEHLCVPAYLFSACNGMATMNYQQGTMEDQQVIVGSGKNMHTRTETHTRWTPCSSSVSVTYTLVASASKDMEAIVAGLYRDGTVPSLIDVEDLDFPDDAEEFANNIPHATAFANDCRPFMDNALMVQAQQMLEGQMYQDLRISGSNINRGDMTRIMLGIYRITFTYQGREYKVYVSGDGQKFYCTDVPVDTEGANFIAAKQNEKEQMKPHVLHIAIPIIVLIIGIICLCAVIPLGIILIIVAIAGFVFRVIQKRKYNEAQAAIQAEIDAVVAQRQQVVQNFISANRRLRGIYFQG